jgi:hypothetical protein
MKILISGLDSAVDILTLTFLSALVRIQAAKSKQSNSPSCNSLIRKCEKAEKEKKNNKNIVIFIF